MHSRTHLPTHLPTYLPRANDYFTKFDIVKIGGPFNPFHGYSSLKFIPGTHDKHMVAIKTVENGDVTETFAVVLDTAGSILMPEVRIGSQKFEGLEFIHW